MGIRGKKIVEEEASGDESFAWISAVATVNEAASSGDEIVSIGEDMGIRELRLDDPEEPLEEVLVDDEEIPDLEDFEGANLIINDPVLFYVYILFLYFSLVRVCCDSS